MWTGNYEQEKMQYSARLVYSTVILVCEIRLPRRYKILIEIEIMIWFGQYSTIFLNAEKFLKKSWENFQNVSILYLNHPCRYKDYMQRLSPREVESMRQLKKKQLQDKAKRQAIKERKQECESLGRPKYPGNAFLLYVQTLERGDASIKVSQGPI